MGEYQRQVYKERDLAKALAKVHGIIDEETQKLSDKCHELQLSYNRMKNLLEMSKVFVENLRFYACSADLWKEAEYLHKCITRELYGLKNYKGLEHE